MGGAGPVDRVPSGECPPRQLAQLLVVLRGRSSARRTRRCLFRVHSHRPEIPGCKMPAHLETEDHSEDPRPTARRGEAVPMKEVGQSTLSHHSKKTAMHGAEYVLPDYLFYNCDAPLLITC